MKSSTLLLVFAGVLIGIGLTGQFEPFRSWMGSWASVATILGVVLAVAGVVLNARRRR